MAITSCFSALFARKNSKEKKRSKIAYKCGDLRVNTEEQVHQHVQNSVVGIAFDEPYHADQLAHSPVEVANLREPMLLITQGKNPVEKTQTKMCDTKNIKFEPTEPSAEAAYAGGDEHEDSLSPRKDFSDFDLQALEVDTPELNSGSVNKELNIDCSDSSLLKETASEMITCNGHASDPGIGRTEILCRSLCLKRSCSYIETKRFVRSPTTTNFSDDILNICETDGGKATNTIPGSPKSVMTSLSADRTILKKSYLSQVLPSRSAKLWSSLFLWSQNNFHNPRITASQKISTNDTSKIGGGYCSDIALESRSCFEMDNKAKLKQSEITTADDLCSQNHWVACHSECSTLDRVDAWVQSLGDGSSYPIDSYQNDEPAEEATSYTNIIEAEEISGKKRTHMGRPTVKDIMEGSYIFQPSCSFPHMAHISGMSLKAIPVISTFSSLRSVNLSGNMIAHIPSGSLPKSLLTLDLSKNKITTIEGLKELIRLRVLNLSYNRISRIGHGFPNGTLIKELYVAGNEISYIEGLHRLLKLKVLDLSFNKITTAKALAQLVANDGSLLVLNLIGNPVLSNFGEEKLRKTICSILPKIAYLNKNPIDPWKGREVALHNISKTSLRSNDRFSQKQLTRRVCQNTSSSSKGCGRERNTCRRASGSLGERSRMDRSKGRHQQSVI